MTVAQPGDTETSGHPLPGYTVAIAPDGEIVVDGNLHTGDLGRLDERGRLIVLGRKVDTIVSGGENVMPTEVEAALLAHPAVAEAGGLRPPGPRVGRGRHRARRAAGDADPAELREFAAQRLARFKVPKAIEPVDSLAPQRVGEAPAPRAALARLDVAVATGA